MSQTQKNLKNFLIILISMPEFAITAEVIISAENKEEADKLLEEAKLNPDSWILGSLLSNCEVTEI